MSIYRQHVTFVGTHYIKWKGYCMYLRQQNHLYGECLFSPSGPTTIVHNSSQYLVLMQLSSNIISHKPGHLSFPILMK